jgi:hypothetical protein
MDRFPTAGESVPVVDLSAAPGLTLMPIWACYKFSFQKHNENLNIAEIHYLV